jgi:hypothetical protein
MGVMPARALLLSWLLTLAALLPAHGQAPVCDARSAGTVACLASKLCACGFERGGSMTGRPAGYRWDCGVLRPGCGGDATTPATTGGYQGALPEALSLDGSRTVITNQVGKGNTSAVGGSGRGSGVVVAPPPAPGP